MSDVPKKRWRGGAQPQLDVDEIRTRLNRQAQRLGQIENDLARIGPQVAGLEERFEDLKALIERPEGDRGEALSLLEEMRREHQQIRARLSAAARFEERLRQVEEKLDPG